MPDSATISSLDLETIKKSIEPKSSNSLPVSPPTTTTTTEPSPSSTEAFRSMYASI
jgi:hypothetical protein